MSQREKPADPKPYYEAHVFCCTNRRPAGHPRGCCAERGGEALRDHMKSRAKALGLKNVRINNAGCLDLVQGADEGRRRRGTGHAPCKGRAGRAADVEAGGQVA